MSKPKPREELDSFTIRPPISIGVRLRELARESGVPVNTYLVAILSEVARRGTLIRESINYTIEEDPNYQAFLRLGEEDAKKLRKAKAYIAPHPASDRLNDGPKDA